MKYKNRLFLAPLLIINIVLFAACSSYESTETKVAASNSDNIIKTGNSTASGSASPIKVISVKYESEDYYIDWKSQSHQTINLNSGSATITKSGIYEVTGTLSDGSLVVNVDKSIDKGIVYIILNNAKISSSKSAPIYIKNAKKVVMLMENGTQNTIYQGSGSVADQNGEPSAAVFSKSDLTIGGSGTLNVTSDFNDGITSKDKLKITDGTLIIKSKGDGIVGKDLLAVQKVNITIDAGKDGLRSTNDKEADKGNIAIENGTFKITSAKDAIDAYAVLQINDGTFNLTSGGGYPGKSIKSGDKFGFGGPGGHFDQASTQDTNSTNKESMKGLKAGSIAIKNGSFTVSSYEDAIHSNGSIEISGGTLTLESGDDAIHSDNSVSISGKSIEIKNSYEGIEGQNITINSGEIKLTSSDDGFNVNNKSGFLTINGGNIHMNAGGDGTDSNGSINMTGGSVYVEGPTNDGNGAIDFDGNFSISGGTIVASGSSGMAQVPDTSSTQASILMYYSSIQKAGTAITLKDNNGKVIASTTPSKQYASVTISAPGLKTGSTYTLYSDSSKVVTFTLKNAVTYLNESGETTNQSRGPGGFGGGGGRGGRGGSDGSDGSGSFGGRGGRNPGGRIQQQPQ